MYMFSALVLHVHKSGGAKKTKFFGRKFLLATGCWSTEMSASVRNDLVSQNVDECGVDAFLEGWTNSISGEDKDLSELVWAKNFSTVLSARRAEREKEIKDRTERMETDGGALQGIKDMITAGESQMGTVTEEVTANESTEVDGELANFSFSDTGPAAP